jgi:hypothetical protein
LSNRHIWWATMVCVAATLLAVYVPTTASVMQLDVPSPLGWYVVLGFSVVPLFARPVVVGLAQIATPARTRS